MVERKYSPFTLFEKFDGLIQPYPDPGWFRNYFLQASETERLGIVRLWITEGILYAFRNNPLLYEKSREFIAKNISVYSKGVTLVGSGRIGYSLKKKVWGKVFANDSDLDFVIVSNDLFARLVTDFQKWASDFAGKRLPPRDIAQTTAWISAIKNVNQNIPKGYINTRHLFNHRYYPAIKKCNETMDSLKQILAITDSAPKITYTSVRIYADWGACVRQLCNNFYTALDLWGRK